MRQIRALRVAAVAAGLALMATGCGATGKNSTGSESSGAAAGPITGLQIMVPNTPGGGYDTTARAAAKVLDDEKIANNTEVFNLAGAGGTVGLARVVNEKGNGDLTMLMGLSMPAAIGTSRISSLLTNFVDTDLTGLKIGQRVKIVWKPTGGAPRRLEPVTTTSDRTDSSSFAVCAKADDAVSTAMRATCQDL